MHAGTHPAAGNVSLCVTVGVPLHVRACKATIVPDLENGWIALKLGILIGTG